MIVEGHHHGGGGGGGASGYATPVGHDGGNGGGTPGTPPIVTTQRSIRFPDDERVGVVSGEESDKHA